MPKPLPTLALLSAAALGGVVVWQRRNETPPTAPAPLEPFMAPAAEAVATAEEVVEAVSEDGAAPLPVGGVGALPDPPREAPGASDDLTRITGIGPKLESLLHEQGITTLDQIAALDADGVDRLQAALPQFPGRIRRDDWVGQARRLIDG